MKRFKAELRSWIRNRQNRAQDIEPFGCGYFLVHDQSAHISQITRAIPFPFPFPFPPPPPTLSLTDNSLASVHGDIVGFIPAGPSLAPSSFNVQSIQHHHPTLEQPQWLQYGVDVEMTPIPFAAWMMDMNCTTTALPNNDDHSSTPTDIQPHQAVSAPAMSHSPFPPLHAGTMPPLSSTSRAPNGIYPGGDITHFYDYRAEIPEHFVHGHQEATFGGPTRTGRPHSNSSVDVMDNHLTAFWD